MVRGGTIVECYIVRIYRRDLNDPSLAEGVVEGTDGDTIRIFHNAGELLDGLDFQVRDAPFKRPVSERFAGSRGKDGHVKRRKAQ
jgi:hypothetical protein